MLVLYSRATVFSFICLVSTLSWQFVFFIHCKISLPLLAVDLTGALVISHPETFCGNTLCGVEFRVTRASGIAPLVP